MKQRLTRNVKSLSERLIIGRHLLRVKRLGLADHIGGFNEWIALCGYTRQQADRLMRLAILADGTELTEGIGRMTITKPKPIVERIRFYTRKANDYSRQRFDVLRGKPSKRPPASRFIRLIAYRDAIRRRTRMCEIDV